MKIGILQLNTVWENPQANIDQIGAELNRLDDNIDILLLPEMYDQGYIMSPKSTSKLDSSWTVKAVQDLAKEFNVLIGGSIPNQRGDD
jgi:predicted amidohydrolase